MDGPNVNTSPLQKFADYVRRLALEAGYNIDKVNSGDRTRLARDAGMSQTTISKLLAGERMPDAKYFAGLAMALKTDPLELFVESGILPARNRSQNSHNAVASRSITPDDVADAWGVDPFGREMVHAMFQRLTNPPRQSDDTGSAAQDG
jgi:transcriptional regulator with XRE-family HTH domain